MINHTLITHLSIKLTKEQNTETKILSMWNGAIKGLIDLDKDLFIKRFDLHSIEDEEFKLLLQKGLLNENTFHQSKNEIENTHQQNSTIGKNKKERNKLDELLKLEEILINHQPNEIQKKTQKSKESKTLSLKDLLTKDDTKIDKRQKTSLLKELFINEHYYTFTNNRSSRKRKN